MLRMCQLRPSMLCCWDTLGIAQRALCSTRSGVMPPRPRWICNALDWRLLSDCTVHLSYRTVRLLQVLTEAKYKGNAADVWSLGVMLYVMIEGQFPFRPKRQRYQMQKLIGRIVNAEYKRCTHVRHWYQGLG